MVFFNWATMQMAAKIVYYGPGLCGKTSNLSFIYAKTAPTSRGEMVSLETESDRTLFFDLLPIEVGTIGGFKTRLQLYTVPGQVFYNTTRKLVLKGVDGLVFVADSQRPMREANVESFQSLLENLKELGLELSDLPLVLQYNKRDLKNILAIEELNADLNQEGNFPYYESSAINGEGVFETLKEITKLTLKKLRKRMTAPETETGASRLGAPSVQPIKPPRPPASISAASLARAAEEGVDDEMPKTTEDTAVEATAEVAPLESEFAGTEEGVPEAGYDPENVEFVAAAEETAAVAENAEPPEHGAGDDEVFETDVPSEETGTAKVADFEEPFGDGPVKPDTDVRVEFDQTGDTSSEGEPPPVKHVHVSNQMDILAELDGLRKQATMGDVGRRFDRESPEIDLDSLLAGEVGRTQELRRKIEKALNSDIFKNMRGLQVAIRIQGQNGDTIHTLDPVSLHVDDATSLHKLCLRFTVDLENIP
jgi:signal recognition particle receptor subunit beta